MPPRTIIRVGDWYEIGVALGLGLAAGLLLAGALAGWRYGLVVSIVGALAVGVAAGLLVKGWLGLPGSLLGAVIGAVSASIIARGALRRGATPGGTAFLIASAAIAGRAPGARPRRRLRARGASCPPSPPAGRGTSPTGTPGSARSRSDRGPGRRTTKLVLVVIDGLTPSMLEAALGTETAPTLTALAERGTLGRATTTFPSLTPVCLSSIATGAHPDVHEIPHLVWWHRGEQRLVEYGSSFGAARAAGLGRTLRDTLVGMNAEHLGRNAVTLFEALADAGLPHRGGQLHGVSRPHAPSCRRPAARRRARPRAVLLLQPLPGRPDRRAALVPEPRRRDRSTRTPRRSGAGS